MRFLWRCLTENRSRLSINLTHSSKTILGVLANCVGELSCQIVLQGGESRKTFFEVEVFSVNGTDGFRGLHR